MTLATAPCYAFGLIPDDEVPAGGLLRDEGADSTGLSEADLNLDLGPLGTLL